MIRVRLQGRMGNQLFQYAFALYASRKLQTKFIVDIRKQDGYQLEYFNLPPPLQYLSFGKLAQRLYDIVNRNYKMKKNFFMRGRDEDWSKRILSDNTAYKGYFQDAYFSSQIKSILDRHLSIRKKYTKKFHELFPFALSDKYAVLHIRFGDYLSQTIEVNNTKLNWSLPIEWYYSAIQRAKLENIKLVIISDDILLARKQLFEHYNNCYFPEGDAITHFQFLLHAETCIISNSSFAWWGAFLNQNKNKKIIAPNNWVGYNAGFEYPKGIMTREFEWLQ
jgi:hypothetical protein